MANSNSQPVFNEHDDHILWVTQQQLLHYYDNGEGLFMKNADTGETIRFLHEDEHRLGHDPQHLSLMESLDEAVHQLDFLSVLLTPGEHMELSPEMQLGLFSILRALRDRLSSHQH
ncbi:hypothetical protein ACL7TT_09890 [Microbulbifer sp. 2304DJ12-6]|uniref:hypothetical protein n=1 Tax=Microbulbifer sp. 2304DJ12-6 TaxID=3233340 RepID=UPI0039AF4594